MPRFCRSLPWVPVAIGLLAGGLGVGAYWLGPHRLAGGVQAEAAIPAPTPIAPLPGTRRATVSARPSGVVTVITTDPSSFTFRLSSGEEKTVRVTPGTVFAAGPDRPYSFTMLKSGDFVRVQAAGLGPKATGVPPKKNDASVKPGGAGGPRMTAVGEGGTTIARRVVVRPAGEGRLEPSGARKQGPGQVCDGQACAATAIRREKEGRGNGLQQ